MFWDVVSALIILGYFAVVWTCLFGWTTFWRVMEKRARKEMQANYGKVDHSETDLAAQVEGLRDKFESWGDPVAFDSKLSVRELTIEQLNSARASALEHVGLTYAELAERAKNHALAGDEYTAWDVVREIDFLRSRDSCPSDCGCNCSHVNPYL